jgi:hypothetical protein
VGPRSFQRNQLAKEKRWDSNLLNKIDQARPGSSQPFQWNRPKRKEVKPESFQPSNRPKREEAKPRSSQRNRPSRKKKHDLDLLNEINQHEQSSLLLINFVETQEWDKID